MPKNKCNGLKKDGDPCQALARKGSKYCSAHQDQGTQTVGPDVQVLEQPKRGPDIKTKKLPELETKVPEGHTTELPVGQDQKKKVPEGHTTELPIGQDQKKRQDVLDKAEKERGAKKKKRDALAKAEKARKMAKNKKVPKGHTTKQPTGLTEKEKAQKKQQDVLDKAEKERAAKKKKAKQGRHFWPDGIPKPTYYRKRQVLSCPKCNRIMTETGGQAVATKAIRDSVAYLWCKACNHKWKMPIKKA